MEKHGRLMIVAPRLGDVKVLLAHLQHLPLYVLNRIPADPPPEDVVLIVLPHSVLTDPLDLPNWARSAVLLTWGKDISAEKREHFASAGVLVVPVLRQAIGIIEGIYRQAQGFHGIHKEYDRIRTSLTRIDNFARRILVMDGPSALMDYLPGMLHQILPFDVLAFWAISQKDLRLFLPHSWNVEQVEIATAQVRKILSNQPQAPALPSTTMRHEFDITDQRSPAGIIKHQLVVSISSLRSHMGIFRTQDPEFTNPDLRLFDLAANLFTTALQNAHLFSQLEHQTRKIIVKNRELMSANRSKANFIANISHEIKTPLHSILGICELLTTEQSADEMQSMISRLTTNTKRLQQTINQMLDYNQLLEKKEAVVYEAVELKPFLTQVADSFHDLAKAKNLELIIDVEESIEEFFCDREKLFRILSNLLSNAVKFTQKGRITCRVRQWKNKISIAVNDTGAGISVEQLAHIFDQFHRTQGPLQSSSEGTGLGLAIVQELTKLLYGELKVESTVGSGTTFTLLLPANPQLESAQKNNSKIGLPD